MTLFAVMNEDNKQQVRASAAAMVESTKKEKTSVVALRTELVEARKEIVRLKAELDE